MLSDDSSISIDRILSHETLPLRLHDLKDREHQGKTLLIVLENCHWNQEWVQWAIEQVHSRTSNTSFVQILFIANPQITWQWVTESYDKLTRLMSEKLATFNLKPLSDNALKHWLQDCNFPYTEEMQEKIKAVTGNWPNLLQEFYQLCPSDPHLWENALGELDERLNNPEFCRKLADSMGFDDSQSQRERVMRDLADWGEATTLEELIEILEYATPEMVDRILQWANLLSLATPLQKPDGKNSWRLNPVVGRILQSLNN